MLLKPQTISNLKRSCSSEKLEDLFLASPDSKKMLRYSEICIDAPLRTPPNRFSIMIFLLCSRSETTKRGK